MSTMIRTASLALLSAITAEFLLGDQWLGGAAGAGQQVAQLVLFTAFYGSAAVLIREIARRSGRGWPSILMLALAFGVIEEGLVDQSLFNPDFAGRRLLDSGFVPALGIGGPWTVFVLTLHVVWSMGAPIAIAEALFPRHTASRAAVAPQVQAPWLRTGGIITAGILCALGAAAIWFVTTIAAGFQAAPAQLVVSLVVAVALVVAALRLPRRRPRATRTAWPAVLVGLAVTSAFLLVDHYAEGIGPWAMTATLLALLAAGATSAAILRLDVLGLAIGAVLSYGWVGLVSASAVGWGAVLEQSFIVLAVLATLVVALGRRSRTPAIVEPGDSSLGDPSVVDVSRSA